MALLSTHNFLLIFMELQQDIHQKKPGRRWTSNMHQRCKLSSCNKSSSASKDSEEIDTRRWGTNDNQFMSEEHNKFFRKIIRYITTLPYILILVVVDAAHLFSPVISARLEGAYASVLTECVSVRLRPDGAIKIVAGDVDGGELIHSFCLPFRL